MTGLCGADCTNRKRSAGCKGYRVTCGKPFGRGGIAAEYILICRYGADPELLLCRHRGTFVLFFRKYGISGKHMLFYGSRAETRLFFCFSADFGRCGSFFHENYLPRGTKRVLLMNKSAASEVSRGNFRRN